MTDRPSRTYLWVALAVFALGLVTRAVPLHWSPLPATLDGLRYAMLATEVLSGEGLPISLLDADEFGFTLVLTATSMATGVSPLRIAQPMVVVTGASAALIAVAFARRVCLGRGLPPRRGRQAATLAGLALAVSGLYVRRTGVPDEEAFGLLLVPLLVIAVSRLLSTRRLSWGVVAIAFIAVFPPLHNLSTAVAVLTLTALVTVHVVRAGDRWTIVVGGGMVGGFWAYFLGFFAILERLGLQITYSGLLREYPGLFVAWVVVLVIGVAWFMTTGDRMRRGVFVLPVVGALGLAVVNAFVTVFPGTITTPPSVVVMVLGYGIAIGLGAVAVPLLASDRSVGPTLLALVVAPVTLVGYLLTASLTPEFFGAALRAQTFGHLTVFVLAGITAAALGTTARRRSLSSSPSVWADGAASTVKSRLPTVISRSRLGSFLVGALLASAVVTAPLAVVDIDTVAYPSTVTPSEFQAATFIAGHVTGDYATDHNQGTIVSNYYRQSSGAIGPTRSWLQGGSAPGCTVVSTTGWTTTGATFYPAGPATISPDVYRESLQDRNLVYSSNGLNSIAVTLPRMPAESTGC